MNQRDKIAQMLEEDPMLRERKMRYVVCARITGVDADTCKLICSIADEFRHQTTADEVGEALEAEWHKPSMVWGEQARLSKKYSDDLQKFG